MDFVVDFLIFVVSFLELLELLDWLFWGDWNISSFDLKSSLSLLDVDSGRLGGGSRWFCCRLGLFMGILVFKGFNLNFLFLVLFARPKCLRSCILCPIFMNICMFLWGCGLVGLVLGVGLLFSMLACLVGCSLGIF